MSDEKRFNPTYRLYKVHVTPGHRDALSHPHGFVYVLAPGTNEESTHRGPFATFSEAHLAARQEANQIGYARRRAEGRWGGRPGQGKSFPFPFPLAPPPGPAVPPRLYGRIRELKGGNATGGRQKRGRGT